MWRAGILAAVALGCRSGSEPAPSKQRDAAVTPVDAAPIVDAPRADTSDMIEIPAGPYTRGCDKPEPMWCSGKFSAEPVGRFYIDRTEVTVEEYARCVAAGKCPEPTLGGRNCTESTANWAAGRARHPMNCLTAANALIYCMSLHKRLPATDEWEKAARGLDGRTYPWGEQRPTCRRARIKGCGEGTVEVGIHQSGDSPFGLSDTVGNVWEFVLSMTWAEYTMAYVDYDVALFADREGVLIRGGGYRSGGVFGYHLWNEELGGRATAPPRPDVGFRCAVSFRWRER